MSIHLVLALTLLQGATVRSSTVVLVLYAVDLGAQPLTIGVLGAMFSMFPMLLAVQAGKLADRFAARGLLMVGAAVGTLGLLLPYFVPGLPAIFMAAALIGMLVVTFNVSLQNLVGLLSSPQDRAKNFSNYSLMGSASHLVGPLIAGFSIDLSGHATACLYLALLSLAPIGMLGVRGGALTGGGRQAKHASGGVRSMLSEPGIQRTLATSSLLHAGNSLYQIYMPVYAHSVGLAASTIGVVLALNSAAEMVVRLILPSLIARFKEEKVLAYAFYLEAASLMMIPFFGNAVMLALMSFIFGLGMGCCGPIVTILMFSRSAEGRSGEGLGLKITVNHLTKVVSPVVFGAMGSAFGLFPLFWINALMMAVGGFLSRAK